MDRLPTTIPPLPSPCIRRGHDYRETDGGEGPPSSVKRGLVSFRVLGVLFRYSDPAGSFLLESGDGVGSGNSWFLAFLNLEFLIPRDGVGSDVSCFLAWL